MILTLLLRVLNGNNWHQTAFAPTASVRGGALGDYFRIALNWCQPTGGERNCSMNHRLQSLLRNTLIGNLQLSCPVEAEAINCNPQSLEVLQ